MLSTLFQIADQLDLRTAEGLDKTADWVEGRQRALADAPPSSFAVVLYNGQERMHKFPIGTAEDVEMSYAALEKNAGALPEEVVRVARYHIDLAGREKLGRALYGELTEEPTNQIWSGLIDRMAYAQKVATEKTASSNHLLNASEGHEARFPVNTPADAKEAEWYMSANAFGLPNADLAEACAALVKRAQELGVPVSNPKVARFGRESLPADFAGHVRARAHDAPEARRPLYEQLITEAQDLGPVKVARCLTLLDSLSGLSGAANILAKTATVQHPCVLDVVFPEVERAVSPVSLEKVADAFGEDFAAALEADSSVVNTLSPAEKRVLSTLVN